MFELIIAKPLNSSQYIQLKVFEWQKIIYESHHTNIQTESTTRNHHVWNKIKSQSSYKIMKIIL